KFIGWQNPHGALGAQMIASSSVNLPSPTYQTAGGPPKNSALASSPNLSSSLQRLLSVNLAATLPTGYNNCLRGPGPRNCASARECVAGPEEPAAPIEPVRQEVKGNRFHGRSKDPRQLYRALHRNQA